MFKKTVKIMTGVMLAACITMFVSVNRSEAATLSEEPSEKIIVKIDKTNFPGLHEVLKEEWYDTNRDGYLSELECSRITTIQSTKEVSSLDGITYFPNLFVIRLQNYTGTKMTVTKENDKVQWISVTPNNKKLTIDAPYINKLDVKTLFIEEDGIIHGWQEVGSTIKTLDISSCDNVKVLEIYQKKLTSLKMPKENDNLRSVSLKELKVKTITLQNYGNLAYLNLDGLSNVTNINLKKNKSLLGIELYRNTKLLKVDVSDSKKLKAIYLFANNEKLKKGIKLPQGKKVKFPNNNISLKEIMADNSAWQDE